MINLFLKASAIAMQLVGTVDQIEGEIAVVEVTTENSDPFILELPVLIFPCEINEGDWFYIEHIDDVTELRCGEPPL